MSGETDGERWKSKTWNYLIGLGVTVAVAVLITLFCLTRHMYERLRQRRRRRRVRVIYVLGTDGEYPNERHQKPHGSGSSTTNPLETKHTESSIVQVESSLPGTIFVKSPNFTNNENETQFGICNVLKQSPSSILNNNFFDLNNNVQETVVYNVDMVDIERPSLSSPTPSQTRPTTRVILGSGIMAGVMGPAYQFLISLLENDTNTNPVLTDSNPAKVEEEINRLTTTGKDGLISMLDLCQVEGNQHSLTSNNEQIKIIESSQNIGSALEKGNERNPEVGSNESVYQPLRDKAKEENGCQCC